MKLKEYITKNCLNPRAFAEKNGISTVTFWRVVKGDNSMRLVTAAKIVKATKNKVTFLDLLTGEELKEIGATDDS